MKRLISITICIFMFMIISAAAYAITGYNSQNLLGINYMGGNPFMEGTYLGFRVTNIEGATIRGIDFRDDKVIVTGQVHWLDICENDIIVEIEGEGFKTQAGLSAAIKELANRDTSSVKILRNGKERTVTIKKEDIKEVHMAGLSFSLGAIVTKVDPGSLAYKAGIKSQDLIIKLNREYIVDPEEFDNMVESYKPGEVLTFELLRGDEVINTEIKLENPEIEIIETEILNNQANAGDKIPLISIKATGNLDIKNSFIWTKVNLINGKQISLKKHNNTVGMTVENSYNEETDEFTSILWADSIKQEADGEYFCQIKDRFNTIAESDKITITVQ